MTVFPVLLAVVASTPPARAQVQPTPAPPMPHWTLDGPKLQQALPGDGRKAPMDALLQDMDGDGDLDLLINLHLRGVLLYERQGPGWTLLNSNSMDAAGLDVPPGVRSTYTTLASLEAGQTAAVTVGQPMTMDGRLDLVIQRQGQAGPSWLKVSAHSDLEIIQADSAVQALDARTVRLKIPRKGRVVARLRPGTRTPHFRLEQLDRRGRPTAHPLPFVVGTDHDSFSGPTLEFWAQDPHGIAWAQISGSPRPELLIARGGNVGKLIAQDIRKDHLFYQWQDGSTGGQPRFGLVPTAVPADSARGRAVAWVDIDADGLPELSLTNRDGPNSFMVWRPNDSGKLVSGAFEDRGEVTGIGAICSEVTTFIDYDQDGWDDLIAQCGDGFEVQHALGVGAFLPQDAHDIGLPTTGLPQAPKSWLRGDHLLVHDLNGDGALDLLAVSLGDERQVMAWCTNGTGHFSACTDELGLASLRGVRELRSADLNLDGWADLLVSGQTPAVLLGTRHGMETHLLSELMPGSPDLAEAAIVPLPRPDHGADDLLILGKGVWQVARSTGLPGYQTQLTFAESDQAWPPGAVLRTTWADGHHQATRVGSQFQTALSQVLRPIPLTLPAVGPPPSLQVRWSGTSTWTPVPVDDQLAALPHSGTVTLSPPESPP